MSPMDPSPQAEKSAASPSGAEPYTYYGTSYSGYSAVGYGESAVQRGFQDYLLILRERVWYIVVVFLLVFSSALVYTFSQTKTYLSSASVQIFRRDAIIMQVQSVVDNDIRSAEDLNTQVKVLESITLVQHVADRLTGEELKNFLAPYRKEGGSEPVSAAEIIQKNRKIVPIRLSLIIQVQYIHPDKQIAARVANLFLDEYIAYNARLRNEDAMKAVDDLKVRADQQKKKLEELAFTLQSYREKNNLVSLDQRKDIVTEKLKTLNLYVTQTNSQLKDAEVRWQQVQEHRALGTAQLAELPFIASQPLIGQLQQQVATQKIAIAQMHEHYRDKHPKMIEAVNNLNQTERELNKALEAAATNVESAYQNARRNDAAARGALAEQEKGSLELDRAAVDYTNMERDLHISEQLLQNTLARMKETSMSSSIDTKSARIVDHAAPALKAYSPNIPLNLALGFLGGLVFGTAFAFFVAYIDGRVKSSFDIESVIGLPLVGIIPEIKRMEQPDKAQIVANAQDKQVAEAFLTLHSALRLKDASKNAQALLVTSTIPGEGKSFVTTNLALTFASHGEKVVIIDCDLRKPNVHKSFRIENLKGVIDLCAGTATIEDVVVHSEFPNLDIIAAGGRAKSPTQILNSKRFEVMLSELRKRYDRILIDTPPLAAVSDALIILPLIDGSVFTLYFNRVRRKAAQFAARRLLEVNVPCFGAVLNGLNLAVSGYYYAQYYDRSYKDYYVTLAKDDQSPAR